MRQLIGGSLRTQAVYVVSKLGIPDQLALGPRSADELAQRVGAHGDALRRVLRFLVACAVLSETEDGRFALTAMGEYLQTAHPRSLRPSAIRAGEGFWKTVGGLHDVMMTGGADGSFFQRLAVEGKEEGFALRMRGSTAGLAEAVASHEAVRKARTVVDVGGGHGALLVALLERHPHLRGILFDTETMIAGARRAIEAGPVADRCELAAGDFFQSIPAGDVYLLSWVLHDWDDERARRILRACSRPATLLIMEVLLPMRAQALDAPPAGVVADPFTLDLQMLLLTGGRERTLDEYRALLEAENCELVGAAPLASARGASLLTARAAPV